MKAIKKMVFTLAILFTVNSYGQNITDANGDLMASINSSGMIKDGASQPLGEFSSNGEVKNAIGDVIGSIDGNQFKDPTGLVLGTIDANNNVFDMNNDKIGAIQNGLTVVDVNNDTIGTTSATIDSKKLAAYFFFFFNRGMM